MKYAHLKTHMYKHISIKIHIDVHLYKNSYKEKSLINLSKIPTDLPQ